MIDEAEGDLLGPFIDRTLRLVEMISIALLALALSKHTQTARFMTFAGELLALIYWMEPTIDWLVERTCGSRGSKTRPLARLTLLSASGLATILTVPYVRALAEALKRAL